MQIVGEIAELDPREQRYFDCPETEFLSQIDCSTKMRALAVERVHFDDISDTFSKAGEIDCMYLLRERRRREQEELFLGVAVPLMLHEIELALKDL